MKLSLTWLIGLALSVVRAGAYNGVSVHNDGTATVYCGWIVNGTESWPTVTPGPGGTQAGDVNTPHTGDSFTISVRTPGGVLIGHISAATCAWNGSTYPCTYNVSGAAASTNYFFNAGYTNNSYGPQAWLYFTNGQLSVQGYLMPGDSVTFAMTNASPINGQLVIADPERGNTTLGQNGQVTGPSSLPNSLSQNFGSGPSPFPTNTSYNLPTTNTSQLDRANTDALLKGQAQSAASINQTLQQLLTATTNGSGGGGKDYTALLTQIAANTSASDTDLKSGTATLNTNLSALGAGVAGVSSAVASNFAGLEAFLTNHSTGSGSVDTNGVLTALETPSTGFNSDLSGKLGSIPPFGNAAPSLVLPFGSLGIDGLADGHLDFAADGFGSIVPPLRAFLLFLVSLCGVFAGYRIIRSFDPS